MTISPERVSYELMVLPFPTPGPRIALAYKELNIAINGTDEEKKALGPIFNLPKPWDPETCQDPELRNEVWSWLEDVVTWINHEYAWDVAPLIPSCWPLHPHIVHEVAVVADAMLGATSTAPLATSADTARIAPRRLSIRIIMPPCIRIRRRQNRTASSRRGSRYRKSISDTSITHPRLSFPRQDVSG